MDPERFIPDPDPALNFLSSRSGSGQKFRIHADQDPTHVITVYLEIVRKKHLKFNHKEESIKLFAIFYIILSVADPNT